MGLVFKVFRRPPPAFQQDVGQVFDLPRLGADQRQILAALPGGAALLTGQKFRVGEDGGERGADVVGEGADQLLPLIAERLFLCAKT